jgi:hypothetical protein
MTATCFYGSTAANHKEGRNDYNDAFELHKLFYMFVLRYTNVVYIYMLLIASINASCMTSGNNSPT